MFDQIVSNQRKTWAILTIFLIVIALLGYFLGIIWGNPYSGVAVAVILVLVALA